MLRRSMDEEEEVVVAAVAAVEAGAVVEAEEVFPGLPEVAGAIPVLPAEAVIRAHPVEAETTPGLRRAVDLRSAQATRPGRQPGIILVLPGVIGRVPQEGARNCRRKAEADASPTRPRNVPLGAAIGRTWETVPHNCPQGPGLGKARAPIGLARAFNSPLRVDREREIARALESDHLLGI